MVSAFQWLFGLFFLTKPSVLLPAWTVIVRSIGLCIRQIKTKTKTKPNPPPPHPKEKKTRRTLSF